MKKPGFSTARERPFKLGPLMIVASVMDARSLTSPALTAKVEAAPLLSASYLVFRVAFIVRRKGDKQDIQMMQNKVFVFSHFKAAA